MIEQILGENDRVVDKDAERLQWAKERLASGEGELHVILDAIEQIITSTKKIDSDGKEQISKILTGMNREIISRFSELIDYANEK